MDVRLALITSTRVTIGIVCLLSFPQKVSFEVDVRYFISVLTQHFLRQPTHHSGHPTLKVHPILGALDTSWLGFA